MPAEIKTKNVGITQEELEKFLGTTLSAYNVCDIGERTLEAAYKHDRIIHPRTLLDAILTYGINPKIKELEPSRENSPKTGEVWRTSYGIIVLYWAEIKGRGDNVAILGGDTFDGGRFDVLGRGPKDTKDAFYKLIFSPFTGRSTEID